METTSFQLLFETLELAVWIALPVLVAAVVSGLLSGIFQATTTVNDSSIGTVPRLVAGALALILAGPWMMSRLVSFTLALLSDLGRFAR